MIKMPLLRALRFGLRRLVLPGTVGLLATFLVPTAHAAFGLTTATDYYQVDTGAGLVFKVRRTDNGVSTQSAGDIMSLVWNGVEYQNQSRGSQITSGFDYLYSGVSAVTVSAAVVNTDYIKVTVQAGNLTHYYMARNGYAHIYMGTYFTTEPDIHGLVRYIFRIPASLLPNGPTPSDIRNNTGAIESGDIFALANGETRSKHYSNMRLKDWSYIGATGTNVGLWVVRDNHEGGSGGPFYRSLLNQCGSDQEITYIVNYGEAQTEAFRTGILNAYTFVATTGSAPSTSIDTSWFANMSLNGYLAPSGRGRVTAVGINGRDTNYTYTVGFSNTTAQYYVTAAASNGYFNCTGMRPGTYTMRIYKNELVVWTGSATVTAGGTAVFNTITITGDPSSQSAIWRIGNWDGTPNEFRNGSNITTMHPQDPRLASWTPGTYVVGSSGNSNFPCYQWKGVNGTQDIQFTLTAAQAAADRTLRVGITVAYAGARPDITVNGGWNSANASASTQPSTRTLTVGTYRGNNTTYTFTIPANTFVAGTNTLTIAPISGSGAATGYLSAGYSVDCVDLY
jgi:rhamnogalacturonan endolyase